MKAKEYFEKYRDGLASEDSDVVKKFAWDMLMEMIDEVKHILIERHCKKDHAVVAVVKEMNARWNAVINLFEKSGIDCPLERNGFWKAMKARIPEIETVK